MVNLILSNRFPPFLYFLSNFALLFLAVFHNKIYVFLCFPKYLWKFHEKVSLFVWCHPFAGYPSGTVQICFRSLYIKKRLYLTYNLFFIALYFLQFLFILPSVQTSFSVHTTEHLQCIRKNKHRRGYLPSEAVRSHGYWSRPRCTVHLPLPEWSGK